MSARSPRDPPETPLLRSLLFAAALLLAPAAQAYEPAVDFSAWRAQVAGPRTQVLVLGSAHLSELGPGFDPQTLEPLLQRLSQWAPTLITHEGVSGEQCDLLRRHPLVYPDMFADYCRPPDDAQRAVGLDLPAAQQAIAQTLAAWPAAPTPAQRRRLAALFAAAGDQPSAAVQWLRLPTDERRAGDGVSDLLVKQLTRAGLARNETFDVAVVLAARLGHERVYAVDDHTSDEVQARSGPGFGPAIQRHWSGTGQPEPAPLLAYRQGLKNLQTGADVLAFYRLVNQPETQRAFVGADFLAALRNPALQPAGRQYLAWYETRNLRMVANIRAAVGPTPGARVLNVVGASHKAYYERYLHQMPDMDLVDVLPLLAP